MTLRILTTEQNGSLLQSSQNAVQAIVSDAEQLAYVCANITTGLSSLTPSRFQLTLRVPVMENVC